MTKTRADVETLKANWLNDPCWPIECTDGFQDHHDELHAFRLAMELKWMADNTNRLQERADSLNCSIELVKYLEHLEHRLEKLDKYVMELER